MRPVATAQMHHVGHVDEEMQMGIATDAMAHIMTVLTDLYSDQQMAVIREYSTNALDSHIDAGNPAPVEITLPTTLGPNFVVRDYGVGLNVDDIRNIYSMYGSSTKRESDAVTGMLGLGCKSGLTYALSFTVDAVKNGVRTVAIVTKNNQGVGTIKILDTAGTTDPNGVTISVPVKPQDVQSFRTKAEGFYKYWTPGTVMVDGEFPTFIRDQDDAAKGIWIDQDILVSKDRGQSYVVMGNVAYPFKWPEKPNTPINQGYNAHYGNQPNTRDKFDYAVTAWVPMGSVNFTPSREALMTTRMTEETLNTLREYIADRFEAVLVEKLRTAPNNWERAKVWNTWRWTSTSKNGLGIPGFQGGMYQSLMIPKGATAWGYNASYDKANKFQDYMSWQDLQNESRLVITDYPHRSLHPSARARLRQYASAKGFSNGLFLCPEGMKCDVLDGRPNVIRWSDVFDNTDAPPKEKRGKSTVVYSHYDAKPDGTVTLNYHTGAFVKSKRPLVFASVADIPVKVKENRYYHRPTGLTVVNDYAKRYDEATWVTISAGQVEKFQRLHPWAEQWNDYINRLNTEALKALTEQDKMASHLNGVLAKVAVDLTRSSIKVTDPDLIEIQKLANHKSPRIDRCKKLNILIPEPTTSKSREINARYPLLPLIYSGVSSCHDPSVLKDLVLYLEAKHGIS